VLRKQFKVQIKAIKIPGTICKDHFVWDKKTKGEKDTTLIQRKMKKALFLLLNKQT
jgi:hypothetical protein